MKFSNKGYIVILLVCFIACRKGGPCEEPLFVTNSGLTIDFIEESTGKYIYEEFFPLYDIDSLKITDEEAGNYEILTFYNLISGTIFKFNQVSFGPLFIPGKDENSFDEKIEKNISCSIRLGI